MYQLIRISNDEMPGTVVNTCTSLCTAIQRYEQQDSNDIQFNYKNYVLNKDYSYKISTMTKYFYIFAVLDYTGLSEESLEYIDTIKQENEDYTYPPEIIYDDKTITDAEKFRIRLLLEYDEFWDDTVLYQ